ncbi:UNVERIFIED_CONTAM: Retrovirus-related Pol polyprotein from transposon RE2 [Sesamum radiatum]|uniref:Retrovirus-related Pol polyprotein from transposon RE2 n=1 Tax=Sesamum radiatum TaxID=300843 RepID=A0AAW2QHE2_SESRA
MAWETESYKYLKMWGSPTYVKKLVGDKLDSRSSLCKFLGCPKETAGYYFYDPSEQKVFVSRNVVFLKKGFSADSREMRFCLKSQTLVDPPKGVKPVGCKWVYKHKLGFDDDVTAFKARLMAKGYIQRPRVDFKETYSSIAMSKSIQILLAIVLWYDYEIWQMHVKTTFLNGFVEEEIYMDQLESFTSIGEEQKVRCLQRSIYDFKQASRSWNTHFDKVIWGYDVIKNDFDPCIYKKIGGSVPCALCG